MFGILIAALVALVVVLAAGYAVFRYIKGKYNEMIDAANKEAEVVEKRT